MMILENITTLLNFLLLKSHYKEPNLLLGNIKIDS